MTHETILPPVVAAADFSYDLLVIGSGPGGQRAAIQAAKLGEKMAMVGGVRTNGEELTQTGVVYGIGKGQYREIAWGQIIGTGAGELIHIGQAVMAFGGTVDYFVNTVFNSSTLAECYKTAASDGINRLGSALTLEPKLEPVAEVGAVV